MQLRAGGVEGWVAVVFEWPPSSPMKLTQCLGEVGRPQQVPQVSGEGG